MTLVRIALLIAAVTCLRSPALAAPGEFLAAAAEKALGQFAASRGVDPDKPSMRFIGFSSQKTAAGATVQVFNRFEEQEVWIDFYGCVVNGGGADCAVTDGQPRCFYVADSKNFSIADVAAAARWGLRMVADYHGDDVDFEKIKFWQTGDSIFARVHFSASHQPATEVLFQCAKSATGVDCGKAPDVLNEP